MKSSYRMTTLFSEPPALERGPSAFVLSALIHGVVFGLIIAGMLRARRIGAHFVTDKYTMRVLNLNDDKARLRPSAGSGIYYRAPHSGAGSSGSAHAAPTTASTGSSGGSPPTPQSVPKQMARITPAPQTLVQPDLPPNIVLSEKIPVPVTLLWSPASTPVKKIVPPPPAPPTAAEVKPSLDAPNQEVKMADLKITSTPFTTEKLPVSPTTTTPVTSHAPKQAEKIPEMTTQSPTPPTPAKVIALSDVRMTQGTVVLPKANEIASTATTGAVSPGHIKDAMPTPNPTVVSKDAGTGGGSGGGNHQEKSTSAGNNPGQTSTGPQPGKTTASGVNGSSTAAGSNASGNKPGTASGAGQGQQSNANGQGNSSSSGQSSASLGAPGATLGGGSGTTGAGGAGHASQVSGEGSGAGSQPSPDHISLPRDGQFGVVVVGASLEAKYPEISDVWSGRFASTVYLHLGKKKSWILQYCLPPNSAEAILGGHLEAPWPYEIVKPRIDTSELDADALMVHGIVNKAGKFETLTMVFPDDYPQQKVLLAAIQQWQFRPATQNGQNVPVEVLLIIPEEQD